MITGTIIYDSYCHQVHMFPPCEPRKIIQDRLPPAPLYLIEDEYEYGCGKCWNGMVENHTYAHGCDLYMSDEDWERIKKEKNIASV